MGQLAGEATLKKVIKAAFVELLEERRDLVREALAEAAEDLGMVQAIREGSRSSLVSRKEIFRILRTRR